MLREWHDALAPGAVLRAMADEIDRGPTFPVPPSVISNLIRERADEVDFRRAADWTDADQRHAEATRPTDGRAYSRRPGGEWELIAEHPEDVPEPIVSGLGGPCPDPASHDESHRTSETTRRMLAEGREYPGEASVCRWCGGVRP